VSKKKAAARKAQTHFETVPLEVVKQIAAEVPQNPTIAAVDEIVERPRKTGHAGSRPRAGRKQAVRT
jgi:hypothetical protein